MEINEWVIQNHKAYRIASHFFDCFRLNKQIFLEENKLSTQTKNKRQNEPIYIKITVFCENSLNWNEVIIHVIFDNDREVMCKLNQFHPG